MAKTPRKKVFKIPDLTDVDEGGGAFHIQEGDYPMRCVAVEEHTSKEDNDGLKWTFEGLDGKAKSKKFYMYTMFTDNSLWKLKRTLIHLGVELPESAFDLDPDDCVGKELMGVVTDDEYEGKPRSKLSDTYELEGTSGASGETTTTTTSGKGAISYSNEELTDMKEDELQELIDKHKLKVDLDEHKTMRRKVAAVSAALEEKGLLKE